MLSAVSRPASSGLVEVAVDDELAQVRHAGVVRQRVQHAIDRRAVEEAGVALVDRGDRQVVLEAGVVQIVLPGDGR
jgi:hypothetical protein